MKALAKRFFIAMGVALWLVACASVSAGLAQTNLRYDDSRRIYTLEYVGNDGVRRQVEIVPPNHIDPEMVVNITHSEGERWNYTYRLTNRPGPLSTQSVMMVTIVCPPPTVIDAVRGQAGWGGEHYYHRRRQEFYCEFAGSENAVLAPGRHTQGLMIRGLLLPSIVSAQVLGTADVSPHLESAHERPDVGLLVAEATGVRGGWYEMRVVAPGRSPDDLVAPGSGVSVVNADLNEACDLGWITTPGVCNSLRTKLEQAGRALERRRNEAAAGQLQAFLNELEAQHGEEPGKHVNDNAYWLLKVNVEFILERMAAGEA